ncbi:MAG TPA: glycosyltransferase [Gemmatimonadales bacterium]|nr:glycosyltransferase [Gemmatimonadales bacterium]
MSAPQSVMEPATDASGTRTRSGSSFISVVVPVVERAEDLLAVYQAFARELDALAQDHEFLFVFDGRLTPSPELLALARGNEKVRILRFARQFGETAALQLGIEKSRGDLIITLPAYFQVQPQGIHLLLEAVTAGADMVVANRSPRLDSWLNRMQSRVFQSIVGGVSDQRFHDMACGVRVMRRSVAEALPLYGDLHRFIPALALREGFRVDEVAVPQHPGDARMRVYGPGIYLRRLLDIAAFFFLAKFTEKPLRFFGLVGSVFISGGAILSLVLLIQRVDGQGIANRPALLLAVLFLALGVQLIGLGLVGEIIVHLRAPHRRAYRVRERA